MADRRIEEKLALDIIVVTSTNDLRSLKGVLAQKGVEDDPVTGVTYAGTPLHGSKVYGLGGLRTPSGQVQSSMSLKSLVTASPNNFGEYAVAKGSCEDPKAEAAWWYLTNGQYGAIKQIQRLAKKNDDVADLLGRVESNLQQRYDAIQLPITSIEDYDAAEQLYADLGAAGLRSFKDQEDALKDALKDASKSDALADELKARSGYQSCLQMLASDKLKDHKNAVNGFQQIADKLGTTVYGRKAKQRLATYGAVH